MSLMRIIQYVNPRNFDYVDRLLYQEGNCRPKERDFDEARQNLRQTQAVLIGPEQLGKELSSRYDRVLSGKTSNF